MHTFRYSIFTPLPTDVERALVNKMFFKCSPIEGAADLHHLVSASVRVLLLKLKVCLNARLESARQLPLRAVRVKGLHAHDCS